ncbi:unnamed protein product [Dovyalis caffra]|uniref:Uncharacterized protein n=1 Tax=Dovyalis caffra TaxID=77055 RepID=A0AAV1SQH9_9ROSI|nr:unnamed protein product [Dovyalis caffra]
MDVDKLNLHGTTSVPSEMVPPFPEEQGAQGQQYVVRKTGISTRKISLLGATAMNQKDAEVFMKQEEGTKRASSDVSLVAFMVANDSNGIPAGNMVIVSSQADLQQASKIIEGYKGQERSMLGSTANDTEEAVQSEESDEISEDVVVMDYAQPHRKPPIHNEKP